MHLDANPSKRSPWLGHSTNIREIDSHNRTDRTELGLWRDIKVDFYQQVSELLTFSGFVLIGSREVREAERGIVVKSWHTPREAERLF